MSRLSLKEELKKIGIVAYANLVIKSRMHERKAQGGLRYYRAEAQRKGINCPKGEFLKQALRQRLAKRRASGVPKRKGELHIFLAYYITNWEAILPRTLEPFGKVTAFNWREHGFDDRAPDWLEYRDRMNTVMLEKFHAANRSEPVDVVVGYLSGNNTSPETLKEMACSGATIFNFCWDDKLNFPGKKKGGRYTSTAAIASVVDLNLTNVPDSIIKYAVHGGLAIFWPEAAHPDVHKPYDVPFEFDVSFVGQCYGWRPRFIRQLGKLGVKVECFGYGWPNGPLPDEEVVKLYSRSRINLGFGGVGYSRKLMCIKGRDFEVPMSGGLYLTTNNPELSLVYDIGKEIVIYRDEEDCAHIIRELLADPELAQKIRWAGRERCLRDHIYEARWSKVFSLVGLLQGKP